MAKTIVDIQSAIKTKIETLKDESDISIFGEVFDYANADFSKYPAVVIKPTGGSGNRIDTHRIERTFSFEVTLYQEQSKAGTNKKTASEKMASVSDQIIQAFDQDPSLSGALEQVNVVGYDFDFTVRPGMFNFAIFKLECLVIVENYSTA